MDAGRDSIVPVKPLSKKQKKPRAPLGLVVERSRRTLLIDCQQAVASLTWPYSLAGLVKCACGQPDALFSAGCLDPTYYVKRMAWLWIIALVIGGAMLATVIHLYPRPEWQSALESSRLPNMRP